jgi:ABC-type multidrug transport system ATPase subunit
MALLIIEDCPKNAAELSSLISDFLTDGMAYTDEEAYRNCDNIIKILHNQKLVQSDNRDTIVAEKLSNPIVINEIKQANKHSGVYREEEFLDPFLDADKSDGNYNTEKKTPFGLKKMTKEEERQKDALDKKIEEFMQHKKRIPAPTVIHDKPDPFKADILINNLTLIIGGKTLLDQAQLKLVMGRKYGLVGRNGIGKTTLINAITRKEIEKFPNNVHIL